MQYLGDAWRSLTPESEVCTKRPKGIAVRAFGHGSNPVSFAGRIAKLLGSQKGRGHFWHIFSLEATLLEISRQELPWRRRSDWKVQKRWTHNTIAKS